MEPIRPDRRRAWTTLILIAGATGLLMMAARSPGGGPEPATPAGSVTDLELFRHAAERVRAGEAYYDAMGRELRAHGYPSRSVFNWRTPVFAWLHGRLPEPFWSKLILMGGALAAVLLACDLALREGGVSMAVAQGVLLAGAIGWCVGPDDELFTELWAGMLIALSVGTYARGWRLVGVAAGLFALFVRELALPYCVVSLAMACAGRRRGEVRAWAGGLCLYALFMTIHATEVLRRLTPADRPPDTSWIQFGGASFLLATSRLNVVLMMLPLGWTALYLPLAMLGLARWRGESAARIGLTAGLYLAAFAVAGNPFNSYWGLIDAPLLAFGIVRAPRALRGLVAGLLAPSDGIPVARGGLGPEWVGDAGATGPGGPSPRSPSSYPGEEPMAHAGFRGGGHETGLQVPRVVLNPRAPTLGQDTG